MSEEHGSPPAEPGIGCRLEEAREKKGLSFEQVEESTKIRARYLRALERGNFDILPAVYVLGSLKTYADFLGLDGAALARELKGLLEPEEHEVADQREPEEDYEAAPAAAVGFNQLFLGMGVVIVSVLAIMTLVSAVAQNSGPTKVSQVDEPSVQEAPQEMDLAGNVHSGPNAQPRDAGGSGEKEMVQKAGGGGPEAPKDQGAEAPSAESLFGDVEFVPMSPAGSPRPSASASATAATPAPNNAASSSASSEPFRAGEASSTPSAAVPNAAPAEDYGDRRPETGDRQDRGPARKMAAEIVADVKGDLREDGTGR